MGVSEQVLLDIWLVGNVYNLVNNRKNNLFIIYLQSKQ